MNTFRKHSNLIWVHGLILFGALTGFFLLMRALGLAENFYLRALNIIFVIIVVYSAIIKFRKDSNHNFYDDFAQFFRVGFISGLIGVLLFAAFMAIYLDQIDPAFMELLQREENQGGLISPVFLAFVIALEGMVSVLFVAFTIVQLKKSRTVENPDTDKKSLSDEPRETRSS